MKTVDEFKPLNWYNWLRVEALISAVRLAMLTTHTYICMSTSTSDQLLVLIDELQQAPGAQSSARAHRAESAQKAYL